MSFKMNIEKDLESEYIRVNEKLNIAMLRGDTSMAQRLARQLTNIELALESARRAEEIEPPVVMPKAPPKRKPASTAQKFQNSLQQQMNAALRQGGPVLAANTTMTTGSGVTIEVRDEMNGDVTIITKDSNGQIISMERTSSFQQRVMPKPRKQKLEPLEIEAKIALTANGMIRCSREAVRVNPCSSIFCQHRADWLIKTESVSTWAQFLSDPQVDTVVKEVHLPICFGLARAKCFIQVRRVGEDGSEGWAEYTLTHALESGDIVVSMLLEPRKGDSLAHAMRAIEGFYRLQPEHDETMMLSQLLCAERGMHPSWLDEDFRSTIYSLPGLNNQTASAVIEDLFCTSNSFARLNSPGFAQRGESGLCIVCFRKKWMMT